MNKSEDVKDAFLEFLMQSSASISDQAALAVFFDDIISSVSYEAQLHIFTGLLEHAKGHAENKLSPAAIAAWHHEIEYIERQIERLNISFGVTEGVKDHSMLEALRAVFGEGVRIMTMEELLSGKEFDPKPEQPVNEPSPGTDKFPQINKFADRFVPTHRHIRSGGHYQKLGDASVEATMDHVVVYMNRHGETFTRPIAEFIERFEELN